MTGTNPHPLPVQTVTTATVPVAVADVLSPSQCKTFLQCTARWYFKYVEHLPDVCTGTLALGRAVGTRAYAYGTRCRPMAKPTLAVASLAAQRFTGNVVGHRGWQ